MKILLTANKTYRGFIDTTWWYFFMPLEEMGHNVCFYDTVHGADKSYSEIIDSFKPDLIFCIMTGDANIAPKEPWTEILKETNSGRTKTFNWFCDDTWRFDSFSSKVCNKFNICSTPEKKYIDNYENIGYDNIVLGQWYVNSDMFIPIPFEQKNIDVMFCGGMNEERQEMVEEFKKNNINIQNFAGLSYEDMNYYLATSKIGVNFSLNNNDPLRQTQMKLRMFEVPAAQSLLMTEYTEGLEDYFEINKEIVTFSSVFSMVEEAKALLSRPNLIKHLSETGHQRFIKDHEAKQRLTNILKQIKEI